jgi:ATP-dependent protease ClpP protease subunit
MYVNSPGGSVTAGNYIFKNYVFQPVSCSFIFVG